MQLSTTGLTPKRLPRRAHQSILTVHIIAAVGLLGDAAAFLAVVTRGLLTQDPDLQLATFELARMLSYVFGIPLSFLALLTGLTLGIGGPWGVLRSPWVAAKLTLILTVIATGAFAIDPALETALHGGSDRRGQLLLAACWQVVALTLATTLSVFKPGGRRRTRGRAPRRSGLDGEVRSSHATGGRTPSTHGQPAP